MASSANTSYQRCIQSLIAQIQLYFQSPGHTKYHLSDIFMNISSDFNICSWAQNTMKFELFF